MHQKGPPMEPKPFKIVVSPCSHILFQSTEDPIASQRCLLLWICSKYLKCILMVVDTFELAASASDLWDTLYQEFGPYSNSPRSQIKI